MCLVCLAAAAHGVVGAAWAGGMLVLAMGILRTGSGGCVPSVEA